MKDTNTVTTKSESNARGVLPNVAHLALDVVDRSQSTAIAVLQDARTELRTAVDGGIEFVEKTANAALRLARKVTQRVDDGFAATLTSVEHLIGSAVKSARETTGKATELATSAGRGIAGTAQA